MSHIRPTFCEVSAWTENTAWQTAWQKVTCDISVDARLVHATRSNTSNTTDFTNHCNTAFDCTYHEILLSRLQSKFGLGGAVLVWIQAFLSDRLQCVSFSLTAVLVL